MAKQLRTESSLSLERQNTIAHAIAEHFLREEFHLMSNSDYRRKLGNGVQGLGSGISAEELHEFILSKLPKTIGQMFGWTNCSISGSSADS